jgi:hypothetical protein
LNLEEEYNEIEVENECDVWQSAFSQTDLIRLR